MNILTLPHNLYSIWSANEKVSNVNSSINDSFGHQFLVYMLLYVLIPFMRKHMWPIDMTNLMWRYLKVFAQSKKFIT